MTCYEERKFNLNEKDVVIRTTAVYKYHVRAVEDNAENVPVYGVKCASVFTDLHYFDPMNSFPPDIMHDCLEGIIPIVIQTVLQQMHSEKAI